MDVDERCVRLPNGMRLDFGGMAKGWAADRALGVEATSVPVVDAGGHIATSKPTDGMGGMAGRHHGSGFPAETIELLALRGEAVATSGRDVRHWQQGETWRHHILDRGSGEPVSNTVLAATVVAPTAVEAEMAAKCAMILGAEEGLAWLDARPAYAGLLVLDDGGQLYSHKMEGYLWGS